MAVSFAASEQSGISVQVAVSNAAASCSEAGDGEVDEGEFNSSSLHFKIHASASKALNVSQVPAHQMTWSPK